MMSARLLRHKPESEQGRFYRWSERMFENSHRAIQPNLAVDSSP